MYDYKRQNKYTREKETVKKASSEEKCAKAQWKNSWSKYRIGFRKYARDKEGLKAFIDKKQEHFSNVSETALSAMSELTHSPELQKLKESRHRMQEGGFDVCSGIREMIEDGRKEGIEIGTQSGKIEQARETAFVLRDMGLSITQIVAAVKTSQETVKQWLDECAEKKCNI